MILTNAVLSLAIGLVSNFNGLVSVPDPGVPAGLQDLRRYHVDSPNEVYLADRQGRDFLIKGGVVCRYSTPGSLSELGDLKRIPEFLGPPTMTSNEVVELATATIRKLVKSGDPLAGRVPLVRTDYKLREQQTPFYWVSWPDTNWYVRYAAAVEIDTRSRAVTFLELKHKGFFDPVFAQQMSNMVTVQDPPAPPMKRPVRLAPYPSTNTVERGIASWLWLCERLGVQPGTETNLPRVNWDECYTYTNSALVSTRPTCQVRFMNGTCFESVNGVAFSHYAADAAFSGNWPIRPRAEWDRFTGKVVMHWEDLARGLEHTLTERLGIPADLLAPFTPHPERRPPQLGTEATKRLVIEWRNYPKTNVFVSIEDTKLALNAEFDLETGELKFINFVEPSFINALARKQGLQAP